MESKKNPNVDLEDKRILYLSIGFAISFLLVITAFDWKFYDDGNLVDLGQVRDDFEEMLEIPPTEQPPPPPPKIQQPEIIEVPDDEEIEEEIEVDLDVEITEDEAIEEIITEEASEEEDVDQIFNFVAQQAEFKGGMQKFLEYVGKKMKYPLQARRLGIEGKVFVQFIVERDGSITDVQAIRGIGAGCDEEAMKVIRESPKWNPGKQRGRAVRVRMVIPITFMLN